MATSTTEDTRRKRAEGRDKRRGGSEKGKGAKARSSDEQSGTQEGEGGPGTMALVLAGAVAGAVIGTTRALRKRRQRDEDGDSEEQGYEPADDDESEEDKPSSKATRQRNDENGEDSSSLRNLAVTVLTEALDALQKDTPTDAEGEDADPEASEDEGEADELDADEEDDEDEQGQRGDREGRPAPRDDESEAGPEAEGGADRGGGEAFEIVQQARQQLAQLVGRDPESTTMVERTDEGWRLALEVVELDRIPPSTDLLASYEVTLDGEGQLLDYARTRRYCRSRPDEVI